MKRDVRKGDRHIGEPQTNLRMDSKLKRELKHLAIDENSTMNALVSEAVKMLLTSRGRKI